MLQLVIELSNRKLSIQPWSIVIPTNWKKNKSKTLEVTSSKIALILAPGREFANSDRLTLHFKQMVYGNILFV